MEKKILQVEDLLQKHMGGNKKVVSCRVENITKPGENYAGIMLGVEISLKENGKDAKLYGVAKTPNFKVNEFFRSEIPMQYKKEIAFYKEIVPTLQKFYEDEGAGKMPDIYPKLYASRFNLTEDPEKVDEHAVILLENLVEQGYNNIDRHVGFDLEGAKLLLRDIATFHASPIALKLKKPHVFDIKIKKYADVREEFRPPPLPSMGDGPPKAPHIKLLELLTDYEEATPYIETVIAKAPPGPPIRTPAREPFATVAHDDLWTNNTMQKIKKGKMLANKLIDFQMLSYQSPVKDLLFFISTSVQFDLLENHFDELIEFYHQEFLKVLQKFNCDTSQFRWSKFKEELDFEAKIELGHIIMLMIFVFAKKGEALMDNTKGPMSINLDNVTDAAKQRSAKIISIFGKRGWI